MTSAVTVRNNRGLEDSYIQHHCPSVFATEAHASRSEKYYHIETMKIVSALKREGFFPTEVMQAGSRLENGAEYAKHLIKFRRQDMLGVVNVPEVYEVLLINSHAGQSPYQILGGIFRFVCSNGLIKGDIASRIRVLHKGNNDLDEIISATYKIAEMGEPLLQEMREMRNVILSRDEQLLFAKYALRARYNIKEAEESNIVDSLPVTSAVVPFQPEDFLRRRRQADSGNDLGTILNVIQENVTKPGVKRYDKAGKKHTVRGIGSIDKTVQVNSLVLQFAEELLNIHKG